MSKKIAYIAIGRDWRGMYQKELAPTAKDASKNFTYLHHGRAEFILSPAECEKAEKRAKKVYKECWYDKV